MNRKILLEGDFGIKEYELGNKADQFCLFEKSWIFFTLKIRTLWARKKEGKNLLPKKYIHD